MNLKNARKNSLRKENVKKFLITAEKILIVAQSKNNEIKNCLHWGEETASSSAQKINNFIHIVMQVGKEA